MGVLCKVLRPPPGTAGNFQQPPLPKLLHPFAQLRHLGMPALGIATASKYSLA